MLNLTTFIKNRQWTKHYSKWFKSPYSVFTTTLQAGTTICIVNMRKISRDIRKPAQYHTYMVDCKFHLKKSVPEQIILIII